MAMKGGFTNTMAKIQNVLLGLFYPMDKLPCVPKRTETRRLSRQSPSNKQYQASKVRIWDFCLLRVMVGLSVQYAELFASLSR